MNTKSIKYLIYVVGALIAGFIVFIILSANKTCVVTYDTKGGTIYASDNLKCGEKAKKPVDPILEGYTFINWLDKDNKEFDFDKPIIEDTTIVAHYQKNA
jgi:hypothetical protein